MPKNPPRFSANVPSLNELIRYKKFTNCLVIGQKTPNITRAVFSCDLRDFQYPSVLCDLFSNYRHYVSFGHGTRVSRKHSQIEGLSKFCLHYANEHTEQHLQAWARRSARPMIHFINSREKTPLLQ